MKNYIIYAISVIVLALLVFQAYNQVEELAPEEATITNYAAEIDNLNYQLNQCRRLHKEN